MTNSEPSKKEIYFQYKRNNRNHDKPDDDSIFEFTIEIYSITSTNEIKDLIISIIDANEGANIKITNKIGTYLPIGPSLPSNCPSDRYEVLINYGMFTFLV